MAYILLLSTVAMTSETFGFPIPLILGLLVLVALLVSVPTLP